MKEHIIRLKILFYKIKTYRKLKKMDDWWYFMGGSCFGLFPPSFYCTHSEEEIKRIRDETLAEAYSMINQLDTKYADIRIKVNYRH